MAITVYVIARLPDGRPASFASVSAYEVVRFLWWEFDRWVASRTADYRGVATFSLKPRTKYSFRVTHGWRRGKFWTTTPWYSPHYVYATFTR